MSLKDHFHRSAMPLLLAAAFMSLAAAGQAQSDRSLARKGNELYKRGNYPDAADAYRQAIIRKPDNTLYKYNLGTTLAKSGKTAEAQQTLNDAAEAPGAPRRRDAYYNMGVALGESTQKKDQAAAQPGAAPATPPAAAPGAAPGPQAADPTQALKEKIATLEQALGAFRKAILTDARDDDAKLNYETVQEMLRQARMELQQQEKQQGQDGKQGNQKQDQQEGQNQSKDQQGDKKDQKNGQNGNSQQKQQKPGGKQNGQNGEDDKGEQLKPEQIDALGLLNLLESEKPDQFKQLFRFRGGDTTKHPKRDW